ncbi:MAG: AraC family transcriptional regulator [Candidatus Azobacteroides sp.]|nr:AraC family transcriptional regulator [Candidatus Azobacteroides sp.]
MKTNQEEVMLEHPTTLGEKIPNSWQSLHFSKNCTLENNTSYDATIFFVIKGSIYFSIENAENHRIGAQEMCVISSENSGKMKVEENTHIMMCSFQIESLVSEQNAINELMNQEGDQSGRFEKLPIKERIGGYLGELDLCLQEGLDSAYFQEIKRRELFLLLFFYYSKQSLAKFLQGILFEDIQFRGFIMKNYQRVKNVQDLAVLANYSTSGFIKRFHRCFNESPYKWMQRQKASQILFDIKGGTKSLQEIATLYNFSSYQHFANFCKVQFGFPPTRILDKYVVNESSN